MTAECREVLLLVVHREAAVLLFETLQEMMTTAKKTLGTSRLKEFIRIECLIMTAPHHWGPKVILMHRLLPAMGFWSSSPLFDHACTQEQPARIEDGAATNPI
jgi:hypothetical protein